MISNNNILANIRSDNALASILSRFDSTYIINMIRDSLQMRFRPYETSLPSIYSLEMNFQNIMEQGLDGDQQKQVMEVREQTYIEIINEICNFYGLEYDQNYNYDIYSTVYWMYDFFVSNFTNYFLDFFIMYIVRNKTYLYQYMNLEQQRKDKDSSTNYSRKITDDLELGMIHANLNTVLDNICLFDISLYDIIDLTVADQNMKQFLQNVVRDINGNIFKEKYASIYNSSARTDVITNVKLRLQEVIIQNDLNITRNGDK